MSRTARIVLPGYPHHVVHRGHYRQVVFARPSDYDRYLATLLEFKQLFGIKLYAYCLMTNHVHLLLAPSTTAGIGLLMKRLAGRHTRRRNHRDDRIGTLWDGRYRSSLVQREDYLLACCRYIELNPVRAGIVYDPTEYPWSSCRYRLGPDAAPWFDPDPCFLAMGDTAKARRDAYRDFLASGTPDEQRRLIRDAVQRGQLTGNDRFGKDIARMLGRTVEQRGPGRPRKK